MLYYLLIEDDYIEGAGQNVTANSRSLNAALREHFL